jgi:epoxyqueuosine reductase
MVNVEETIALSTDLGIEARRLGFAACGIASAEEQPQTAAALEAWLKKGLHGDMEWMAARTHHRRSPRDLWPDVRSVICLAMSYAPSADPMALAKSPGRGRISKYAQGGDYHGIFKKAEKALARWLITQAEIRGLGQADVKVFVDTAPVMEKPLAQAGGLGWQGKHTNLVSKTHGSWLFLGEIYTTLELPSDAGGTDSCGSCTACQNACPTDAFPAPYQLDARRCLSYLTIEHRGAIPEEFREAMGNRIYGCDDCLAVCPWNKFAQAAQCHQAFLPRAELAAPALADLLCLDDAGFRNLFSGSPIKRIGRDRLIRNCLIAAGNSADPALLPLVAAHSGDGDPVIAEAADWAARRLAAASSSASQAQS